MAHLLCQIANITVHYLPYVFEQFELLGSYNKVDDNPDKNWTPKGETFMRYKEIPLGDVVIKFLRLSSEKRMGCRRKLPLNRAQF
jgi:hypothetical protein